MNRELVTMLGVGVGCLFVAACSPAKDGVLSEEVGSAHPAQFVPEHDGWRLYSLTFANDAPLADVLVIGDDDVGSYEALTEYWYVNTSDLQYIGEEDIEVEYYDSTGSPPSLAGGQQFTQPVFPTWNSFTSDPVSIGELYQGNKFYLRIKIDSGEIYRLTWYQTIDEETTPGNVTPSGTLSVASGPVSVPFGDDGYYIDATIE